MRDLNAVDMLTVWEQGLNQPLLQRALILLSTAFPNRDIDCLAKLSIGQRDQHLLQLRARLFGQKLVNTSVCPECAERIEWENSVADFLMLSDENSGSVSQFDLDLDDFTIRFRLPNSLDIANVINCDDTTKANESLLVRCIQAAECSGEDYAIEKLPEHIVQAISQRIESLEPQAEILINLHCPECSHNWGVLFDIASFLWAEINDWAERTLQMIHKLARGYGWSEQEILNLSPVRQQLYIGMLGS